MPSPGEFPSADVRIKFQSIWLDCRSKSTSLELMLKSLTATLPFSGGLSTVGLLRGRSYRLGLILEDLPGFLLVAQLLDALPLQVALLALLKQWVCSPVSAQELGGWSLAQDCWEYALISICSTVSHRTTYSTEEILLHITGYQNTLPCFKFLFHYQCVWWDQKPVAAAPFMVCLLSNSTTVSTLYVMLSKL